MVGSFIPVAPPLSKRRRRRHRFAGDHHRQRFGGSRDMDVASGAIRLHWMSSDKSIKDCHVFDEVKVRTLYYCWWP